MAPSPRGRTRGPLTTRPGQELSDAAMRDRSVTSVEDGVDFRRQGVSRFNLGDAAKVRRERRPPRAAPPGRAARP